MTRARSASVSCLGLAVLFAAGSSVLHAQRVQRRARPIDQVRMIALGERQPHELVVQPSGHVRLCSSDELVRIDLRGNVWLEPLADLGYAEPGAEAIAISSDGAYLGGFGFSDALYFEAMWWHVGALDTPHALGGEISQVLGVENTPDGLVAVGFRDGLPFDSRPDGGGDLPLLPTFQQGEARGLSADGSVYCGRMRTGFQTRAVRWVDRVPEALDDPAGTGSEAEGVSRDGTNFAGGATIGGLHVAAVWLAQDGLALRPLRKGDGNLLNGLALGVLDDGFTFGESWGSPRYGWIWHPSWGTDSVMRFQDWLAALDLPVVHVESVRGVHATVSSYQFSLWGGNGHESWYVQTPKGP